VTVRETFAELVRHPVQCVIVRWHWKSAFISAIVRSLMFFVATLGAGSSRAGRASIVEFLVRVPLVGALASVAQRFRLTEPAWAATAVTTVCLPLVAHAAELAAHTIAGTPRLGTSLPVSIAMSACATTFNLFAMRRGILIVGEGARSLLDDLKALPRLLAAAVLSKDFELPQQVRSIPDIAEVREDPLSVSKDDLSDDVRSRLPPSLADAVDVDKIPLSTRGDASDLVSLTRILSIQKRVVIDADEFTGCQLRSKVAVKRSVQLLAEQGASLFESQRRRPADVIAEGVWNVPVVEVLNKTPDGA
jgi:hypothetical protein